MASPAGNFSYPPPGSSLYFNYVDSVVTSWLTFDQNATDYLLEVWYWQYNQQWTICYNRTVLANGTAMVPLNFASGDYTGNFNLNYTASNGTPYVIYSPYFHVEGSPRSWAVTWSQGVLAGPTASILASSASPAMTMTSSKPASVVPTAATPSSSSVSRPLSTSGSRLGTGAVVGIVLGIVVCAGLAAAFVFYRRRKPNATEAEVKKLPSAVFRLPVPDNSIEEKDGSPLRPKELSGDGQILEMAAHSHLGTN